MPVGWMIFALALFFAIMVAVKMGLHAAIGAWGWWIIIPIALILFPIYRYIDRSDAKKRQRDIND